VSKADGGGRAAFNCALECVKPDTSAVELLALTMGGSGSTNDRLWAEPACGGKSLRIHRPKQSRRPWISAFVFFVSLWSTLLQDSVAGQALALSHLLSTPLELEKHLHRLYVTGKQLTNSPRLLHPGGRATLGW
jgi:hypothetical protein